jgi:GNAT superfamily N-acetyltransferase
MAHVPHVHAGEVVALAATADHFAHALRRRGLMGTVRRAARRVHEGLFVTQHYLWYELPLQEDRPRRPLPEGVVCRRAQPDEVDLLAALDRDPELGRQYLAGGHDLWLALDDGSPAFGCWIFRGTAPLHAGDWFDFAPDLVCLEDSVTSPDHRGRGIAPAAWSHIADELAAEGLRSMLTKVATSNLPSRRAVLKAGFQDVALMHFSTLGSRHRVAVDVLARGTGEELQRRLA